jgi:hypothetical protein
MTPSMRSRRPHRSESRALSGARTRIGAVLERDLAARPPAAWWPSRRAGTGTPVRGERVAALRRRLAEGTLVPDPARIARALRARQIL